jgi:hypothetical protein
VSGHVVLLGDSVFDNGAYVGGGPDVGQQLQTRLPSGWRGTLAAVDGATVTGVARQLQHVPRDASHLVISVGGNDALGQARILEEGARSVAEALIRVAEAAAGFERNYRGMLDEVLRLQIPTSVCTIYYPRFPDHRMQAASVAGLAFFNDCILREAFIRGLAVIDLRLVCNHDADYANPIEPSVIGGEKIAGAITRLVQEHDPGTRRSAVFVR